MNSGVVRLALIALFLAWRVSAAEPIAVVTAAGSALESLPVETLKLIYLRKSQIDADGNRWVPLNLPANDGLRRDFSSALFGSTPEDQEDYWNEQYFHGIAPPKVLASEEAVLRFLVSTPGAIGYVHKPKVDDRVKVLLLLISRDVK